MAQDRIAVIGMAGRFPGALDTRELWSNLERGVVSRRQYTNDELLRHGVAPKWLDDPNYVKAGYPIDHADMFDAEFFGMSPREAAITDPQQRLFLECVWVALETAGYDPSRYAGDIGLYAGAKMNSYLLRNLIDRDPDDQQRFDSFELLLGNDKDYLTTRVSYKLNLTGPSIVIQTACSSSLVAVHYACEALINGDCDMAVAGGVSVRVPLHAGYYCQKGAILSPDGYCRAYSDDATGTVEGNGAGVVVLKRLEDAVEAADTILAVIRGSAVNNDGSGKIGFTAPSGDGQTKVVSEAMQVAGVNADDMTLVEGHGTGTTLGDPVEVTALTNVYRRDTDRTGYCALGSVKANIGHLDTAAGIASFMKAVLSLQHKTIAPVANYRRPNPKISLEQSPFYIPLNALPWSCTGPRIAGVTSLGIGGTNCHVIVEEAPAPAATATSNWEWHMLALSARSPAALRRMSQNLADHLQRNTHLALADVAWTLLEGRKAFPYRRAVFGRDMREAIAGLLAADGEFGISGQASESAAPSFTLAVAPLTCRSLKQLATCFNMLPALRNELSVSVDAQGEGFSAADAISRVIATPEIDDEYLESTEGQLLQLTLLRSLAQWLISAGLRPQTVVGEPLVCACISGAVSLTEAFRRLRARETSIRPAGFVLPQTDVEQPRVVLGGDTCASELQLLRTMAELWTNGLAIQAGALYGGERRTRLPLSTYAFEYQRYWVEPAQQKQPAHETPTIVEETPEIYYYVPSWTMTPSFKIDLHDRFAGKHVLLIHDEPGQARQWASSVLNSGAASVARISRGAGFRQASEDAYTVDPANPQDYERCFAALAAADRVPRYIVYCSRLMRGDADFAATKDLTELWDLTALVQGMGRSEKLRDATLAIVTQNTQDIINTEALRPDQAVLECFVRSVPLEYPHITVKLFDIDILAGDEGRARLFAQILDDLAGPGSSVMAYRNGIRWRKSLQRVLLPPLDDRVENDKKRRVYLVTGGLGDIALELCTWLAERGPCEFVLLAKGDAASASASAYAEPAGLKTHVAELQDIERRLQHEGTTATREQEEFFGALERLCVAYVVELIRSRQEVKSGEAYDIDEIVDRITPHARFRKYVHYLLRVLTRAQVMQQHSAGTLTVAAHVADVEPADVLRRRVLESYPRFAGMVDLLSHCASQWPAVFAGDIEPTKVLYPDGSGELLDRAYRNTARDDAYARYSQLLLEYIRLYRKETTGGALRILEIGGGEGNLTKTLLPALDGRDLHYCFTDISRSFVLRAEARARSHGFNGVTFATLDITKDLEAQGFTRQSFDMVVGLDVVHATPDIEHTLRNVSGLLKDGGVLGLVETTRDSTWLALVMGLTGGWWAFRDDRDMSPLLEPLAWNRKLDQMQVGSFAIFPEPTSEPRPDCSLILIEKRQEAQPKEAARRQKLQRLKALGAAVVVLRADVANRQELTAALRQLGPLRDQIDGVLHTAGVVDGKLIQGRTRDDIDEVLAPKVGGVQNLYDELKDRPLSMWVNCSSIVAVSGAVGQFAHCAANQYLDAFTAYLRRNGQPNATSINWEAWTGIGQAEESLRRFREQMTDRFISGRGQGRGLLTWSELTDGRYTVYETTFSQSHDWFLRGHQLQGRSVLPSTVFVEMAVEAAKAAYGNKTIELSELNFLTPLFLDRDEHVRVLTVLDRCDQHHELMILSVRGDVEQAQLHVTGRTRVSPVHATVKFDVTDLEQRCAGAALRERIEDNDARWNCLGRASLNKNMGLAEVILPDEYPNEAAKYTLHPAMLDVAIAFLPLQFRDTSAYVPVHYKKVTVFEALPARLHAFARFRGGATRTAESLDLNVTLLDPAGRRLVDVENLSMRRVHAETQVPAAPTRNAPEFQRFLQHVKHQIGNWLTPAEGIDAFGRILASGLPQVVLTKRKLAAVDEPLAPHASNPSRQRADTSAATTATDLMKARPALKSEYIAASHRIERILSEIWSSVLGVRDVGVEDNFFELGGDSMLSIQVSSLVNDRMQVEVPSGLLFEYPTIRKLSGFLQIRLGESEAPIADADTSEGDGRELAVIDALVSNIRRELREE